MADDDQQDPVESQETETQADPEVATETTDPDAPDQVDGGNPDEANETGSGSQGSDPEEPEIPSTDPNAQPKANPMTQEEAIKRAEQIAEQLDKVDEEIADASAILNVSQQERITLLRKRRMLQALLPKKNAAQKFAEAQGAGKLTRQMQRANKAKDMKAAKEIGVNIKALAEKVSPSQLDRALALNRKRGTKRPEVPLKK